MGDVGYWLVVVRTEAGIVVVADTAEDAVARFQRKQRRYLRRVKPVVVEILHVVPAPPEVWKHA